MSAVASKEAPRDLLRISELTRGQLAHLLDLAMRMKAEPLAFREAEAGKALACYFAKPSTRTRVSLEGAAWRLGMLPIMPRPDELQLGRGEPIPDTASVLSGYVDAIAVRTFAQREVEELAAAASVPVINALTDEHHPCQALADLLTLRERFGESGRLRQTYLGEGNNVARLRGLRLAYVGDGNNVANSLIEAGALLGMEVAVATPPDYHPDEAIVAAAREVAERAGGSVSVFTDPAEAVAGANAVYTDVWVSMGDEEEQRERLAHLRPYQVNEALMANADRGAVFMQCLPAHRGEEVTEPVIDGPRSVVFEQAANRLPTEQALIHTLVSDDWAHLVAMAGDGVGGAEQ
ncbi:MAG: ornithine carbamoyltransferase [Solirubrobacterales bacterium]|nr:ornithine carbamoyltransferase [Solirubrobacterales bacterium]